MAKIEKYPIDFEELQKGDVLDTAFLERALGISRADGNPWNFAMLSLVERIHSERTDLVARQRGNCIVILSDLEADEHLMRKIELLVSKLSRTARFRVRVDRQEFTPQQRQIAESRDRVSVAVATSARGTLKKQRRIEALNPRPLLDA